MNKSRKWGGEVVALLISVLAISEPSSAINLTISQPTGFSSFPETDSGQSFINDPSGTGAAIKLNDWTFGFSSSTDANTALSRTLTVFGLDNAGLLVGSSTTTSLSSFGGGNSVQWTFAGGLDLIDNLTYTAVVSGVTNVRNVTADTYPNGTRVYSVTTVDPFRDTVFQANFSAATPVPFEFEPTGGLLILGGGWLLRRHLKKKKSTKG